MSFTNVDTLVNALPVFYPAIILCAVVIFIIMARLGIINERTVGLCFLFLLIILPSVAICNLSKLLGGFFSYVWGVIKGDD
jgi:hypothetical protein